MLLKTDCQQMDCAVYSRVQSLQQCDRTNGIKVAQRVFIRVCVNCVFYSCKLRLEFEDNVMKD